MPTRSIVAAALAALLVPSNLMAEARQDDFVRVVEKIRAQPLWYDNPVLYEEVRELAARAGFDLVMEATLIRLSPPVLVTILPFVIIVAAEGKDPIESTTPEDAFMSVDRPEPR